jgi:hypothetical protein
VQGGLLCRRRLLRAAERRHLLRGRRPAQPAGLVGARRICRRLPCRCLLLLGLPLQQFPQVVGAVLQLVVELLCCRVKLRRLRRQGGERRLRGWAGPSGMMMASGPRLRTSDGAALMLEGSAPSACPGLAGSVSIQRLTLNSCLRP